MAVERVLTAQVTDVSEREVVFGPGRIEIIDQPVLSSEQVRPYRLSEIRHDKQQW